MGQSEAAAPSYIFCTHLKNTVNPMELATQTKAESGKRKAEYHQHAKTSSL